MTVSNSLNILYVGMLPPHPGGSGISWFQLLSGFVARGNRVRSLSPITAGALGGGDALAREHPELGVRRYLVPHFYTGPNVPASDDYLVLERREIEREMTELIEAERPDILISGRETFGLHVPAVGARFGIPTVQGIRGNTAIAILKGEYPQAHAERLLAEFRRTDLLISVARHLAEGLAGLGFGHIETIPNALDLGQFRPIPRDVDVADTLRLDADDCVVMHLSNLKAVKRPLDLVGSAEIALRSDPHLRYVVVGDGAFREAMERECQRKRVSSRFRFVGWVEHARIPAVLSVADLVVSMSGAEGLSRVYLEAQASGRLLLASDIPPAREVVEDGVTGLLFRKGDARDLAAKTVLAARSPELRKEIGGKAHQRVQEHGLDQAVSKYLECFGRCIRRHGMGRCG